MIGTRYSLFFHMTTESDFKSLVPTFSDKKMVYEDLLVAHDKDHALNDRLPSGKSGPREEAVYPAHHAATDNIRYLIGTINNIETYEELSALEALLADPSKGRSQLEPRIGANEEIWDAFTTRLEERRRSIGAWEYLAQDHKQYIEKAQTVTSLLARMDIMGADFRAHRLGHPQYRRLCEAVNQKAEELRKALVEKYVQAISSLPSKELTHSAGRQAYNMRDRKELALEDLMVIIRAVIDRNQELERIALARGR